MSNYECWAQARKPYKLATPNKNSNSRYFYYSKNTSAQTWSYNTQTVYLCRDLSSAENKISTLETSQIETLPKVLAELGLKWSSFSQSLFLMRKELVSIKTYETNISGVSV